MSRAADVPPPEPGAEARGPQRVPAAPVTRPPAVAGAALLLLGEALALLAGALWGVVVMATGSATDVGIAAAVVVFALLLCAAVLASARGLWRGRRAARAPAVGWQVLQGATAAALLQVAGLGAGLVVAAGLALAMAVTVVGLLLTPAANRFMSLR